MYRDCLLRGLKRGEAPFQNCLPSPLIKGRGIKGEGLVNTLVRRQLPGETNKGDLNIRKE